MRRSSSITFMTFSLYPSHWFISSLISFTQNGDRSNQKCGMSSNIACIFFPASSLSGMIMISYHLDCILRTRSAQSVADFIHTTFTQNCAKVRKSNIHSTTNTFFTSMLIFVMKHHLDCVHFSIMNFFSWMSRLWIVMIHDSSYTAHATFHALSFAYADTESGSIHLDDT